MDSFRRQVINYNTPIVAVVFSLACLGYTYLSSEVIPRAASHREQQEIIADVREVITGELTEAMFKRETSFNPQSYRRTNEVGMSEYDFDALSKALVLQYYKSSFHQSNKVDIIDALIDAGRMQGLQMAREILDEVQRQHR